MPVIRINEETGLPEVDGNMDDHHAPSQPKGKREFKKQAHLFAHRKQGAQVRFQKLFIEMKEKVEVALTVDAIAATKMCDGISKWNAALAKTKKEMMLESAQKEAKSMLRNIQDQWRAEIQRITSDLQGYPQEDGNILFPDGSIAKMPKGLYIPVEQQLKFE